MFLWSKVSYPLDFIVFILAHSPSLSCLLLEVDAWLLNLDHNQIIYSCLSNFITNADQVSPCDVVNLVNKLMRWLSYESIQVHGMAEPTTS